MTDKFVQKAAAALANPTRLAVLLALKKQSVLTALQVMELVGLSQSAVSHHIKQLADSGLVNHLKEGRNVRLHLDKDGIRQLMAFLTTLV
ncbi:ArsR/SmtB family transcription factor [Spirosoma arcticum]